MKQLAQSHGLPVIVSTHPRTRQRLDEQGVHDSESDGVRFLAPLSFFDFVALEQHARCVLSDSGTVQEECAILGVPNVTLRDVTERPETVECGCSILSGVEPDSIQRCVQVAVESASLRSPPPEYLRTDVSQTVVKIILGFRERR